MALKITRLVTCKHRRSSAGTITCREARSAWGYRAPEVVQGEPHCKPIDWWALGIIHYYFLAVRLPFIGLDIDIQILEQSVPILKDMPDDAEESWHPAHTQTSPSFSALPRHQLGRPKS